MATLVETFLGADLPVGVRAYDGSARDVEGARATIVIRSPDALRRMLHAPGELGLGRAYVAGDLDVEGDMYAVLELRDRARTLRMKPSFLVDLARLLDRSAIKPLAPPPEEIRLSGRRHAKDRDAAAISHHYDVSNEFYRLVLGPTMTYSCAVFSSPTTSLDDAQEAKYALVAAKLGLQPGMRLLDVGCGWGGMVLHAAAHHGVTAVGVTLSRRQAELAEKRVAEMGLGGQVEVRVQDYRDITDPPFDAISSIGMFEHVGLSQLGTYFDRMHGLLRPGGRFLNHAIARPPKHQRWPAGTTRFARRGFIDRYVFPDGELHEVGSVVTAMQEAGFEVRHLESLREHYALTLRHWVANLEQHWDEAVAKAGVGRARVWRLYMAGAAVNFEDGHNQIHQTLGVRANDGSSGFPLRGY